MRIPNGYNTAPGFMAVDAITGGLNTIGDVFFVDANAGVDTNDGLTWESAFKTLAVAITANNASIAAGASGWANRNRIYYKGDNKEADAETLITLANKCDIIGVGSFDAKPYPVLIGNHVIGAGAYMGCRFINMGFRSPAAGGVIFTVPTTTSGLEFLNCEFMGDSTVKATKGILATAVERLKIKGCRFVGAFSTSAIEIGAGESNGMLIEDSLIESAAAGIVISATMTATLRDAIVQRNVFDVGTLCLTDGGGGVVKVFENRGRTASNGSIDETLVCTAALSCNNIITCSAGTQSVYPPIAAIPA